MSGIFRVGAASWSDPGFVADWYPPGLPAAERLPYYAERFNLVELNSSFYAVPNRNLVRRWGQMTPADFVFDVKLHRLLSRHSTEVKMLPPNLRAMAEVKAGKVQLNAKLEAALTRQILEEVRPLLDAGKLGAFLLQLTPGFSPRKNSLEELDTVFEVLQGHRVAVELRNRNWVDDEHRDRTSEFLAKRGLTFVSVDAPQGEHFMTMPGVDLVTNPKLTYLRLHGRNLKGYVTGRTVAERFDHLYSDQEMAEIADRATRLAKESAETHVIYNNNASDYAVRNAGSFQQLLAKQHPNRVVLPSPGQGGSRTLEFEFVKPKR